MISKDQKVIIQRTAKYLRKRYNIMLDKLSNYQQKFLRRYTFLENIADHDQTLLILFSMREKEDLLKKQSKLYIDPIFNEINKLHILNKNTKYKKWNCAICNKSIYVDINNIKYNNFICDECYELYEDKKIVDKRILKSSIKFYNEVRNSLKTKGKSYIKYIRKNYNIEIIKEL